MNVCPDIVHGENLSSLKATDIGNVEGNSNFLGSSNLAGTFAMSCSLFIIRASA